MLVLLDSLMVHFPGDTITNGGGEVCFYVKKKRNLNKIFRLERPLNECPRKALLGDSKA